MKIQTIYLTSIGAIVVLLIISALFAPQFLTVEHQSSLLKRLSVYGLLALGQTLVVLVGGVDLSIGANMLTLAIFGGDLFFHTGELLLPIIIVFVLGALIGFINGVGVGRFKVPPIVMTLGMMTLLTGFVLVYTGGSPVGGAPPALVDFVFAEVINVPVIVIVWIVLAMLLWFFSRRTTLGRKLYAVGSNPRASYILGIETWKIYSIAYTLAGVLAAIASLIYLGRVLTPALSVAPAGIGTEFLLPSLVIPVLGGCSFKGGEGSIIGALIATYLYGMLRSFLLVMGFGEAGVLIFTGVILLGVLIFQQIRGGRLLQFRKLFTRK